MQKRYFVVKLESQTATKVTLQHTQSSRPRVLESHTVTSRRALALIDRICLALQSKGERGDWVGKERGMGLRGRLASRWNGAVAEAGMQVSQQTVELKVQLLTGREGVRVGEVSGWPTQGVPRIQTQNHSQEIQEIIQDFLSQLVFE